MNHALPALILAASHAVCFAAGLIAERRRLRRLQVLTPHQVRQAIHPPEVRGQVVDLAEHIKRAPRFVSTRDT